MGGTEETGVDIDRVIAENDTLIDEADDALVAVAELASFIRAGVVAPADPADRQIYVQTVLDDLLEIRARLITQKAYLNAGRKLHS